MTKRLHNLLPVLFLAAMPYAARAQHLEIKVINDAELSPVNASSPARRENWWLFSDSGNGGGAAKVTVDFHEPRCSLPEPASCGGLEWSQTVEVQAVDEASRRFSPPYYLVRGGIDGRSVRQVPMRGRFDLAARRSEIEVSLDGTDYVISRSLSEDEYRVAVSVRAAAVEQQIYACDTMGPSYPFCGDEGFEEIVWAGDLDGDGGLDLLGQFTAKYSVRHYYLFTSRGAGAGDLVALSAEYEYVGD